MTHTSALARAAFVYALSRATRATPADLFRSLYPTDSVASRIFSRSAAPLGTTSDSGYVAELVQTAVGEFLAGLAPLSAAAALMRGPSALTVDVTSTYSAWNLPVRSTDAAVPGWVAEGAPIEVTSGMLTTVPLGPARKLGAMIVMTREATKRSDAQRVFETILREDAAKGLDAAVLSDAGGTGTSIAGLLHGATAVVGCSDPLRDMTRLAHAVSVGGSGQVVFIGGTATAAALNLDARLKAPVLPSPAVADSRLIAVDPMSIAWGADSEPSLEVSTEAILHMDTDPAEIVAAGPTPAAPVRSLWQTDAIVTRLILDIAFVARRAGACAYVDDVDYVS